MTMDFSTQKPVPFIVSSVIHIILLDIVQSFPLLSYCIVSPIYISPICNVEIRFIILWK